MTNTPITYRSWNAEGAGPRQAGKILKLLKKLDGIAYQRIRGRTVVVSIGISDVHTPLAHQLMAEIHRKAGGVITAKNAAWIVKDLEASIVAAEAARPRVDYDQHGKLVPVVA